MNLAKIYYRIRNYCGFLGMILPYLALFSAGLVSGKQAGWWHSISATYYNSPALVAILTAAAIVLMTYDGYSTIDEVITTASGVFGLCIVLFPCSVGWLEASDRVGFFQFPMSTSNIIHVISSVCFFVLLSFNCLFLFTKYDKDVGMTDQKKIRNKIYIICGAGMIASLLLIVALVWFISWIVLIGEILALQFFGFAWLTKGGVFFKDKDTE